MLNRRKFLRVALLSVGAVPLADLAYSISGNRLPQAISEILQHDLKGLHYNLADINTYATEVVEKNALGLKFTSVQLVMLYHGRSKRFLHLPFNKKYSQIRNEIVGNFLLSTDFFYNKMNGEKPIKYSGSIYKPYQSACLNPFSGLYYAA